MFVNLSKHQMRVFFRFFMYQIAYVELSESSMISHDSTFFLAFCMPISANKVIQKIFPFLLEEHLLLYCVIETLSHPFLTHDR